jgi:hypothetical protein
VPLITLGVSRDLVGSLLAYLSILAYLGVLAVTWRILRTRSRALAGTAVLVLTSGLPLHYANRSFGEMPAAFLTLAFAAAWLEGKTILVAVSAFFAALTKEPAPLLLAMLGVICGGVRCRSLASVTKLWILERGRFQILAVSVGLATLLAITLNLFRFGVPYNLSYFGFLPIGPPIKDQLNLFLALWLAPNAGLLFFWPLFVTLFLSIPIAVRKHSSSSEGRVLAPFWGTAVLLAIVTALCAAWWAPFGWSAWGQRLMLPWLPASLLVLCVAYSAELESVILRALRSPGRWALLTAIVIVLGLPHLISIFRSDELIEGALGNHPDCAEPSGPERREPYYRCVEALAWTEPSPIIHAYRLLAHPFVRWRALLYSALLALGGARLYREGREKLQLG